MTIPQRRPVPGAGRPAIPGHESASDRLDRLVKAGRITPDQAAQYRVWESARPPIDAGREWFDAWMSSRPNLPGMPRMGTRPAAGAGKARAQPARGPGAPALPSQKSVLDTVNKLERENKITEAEAEQVRRWERKRPAAATGQETMEAWLKARATVPGLRDFWG
jgi:hypothetical protein